MMSDPWQVLGVDRSASPDEIKTAYRKLAREHHPDLGGSPDRFRVVQQAYDQISNPQTNQNHHHDPFGGQNPFEAIFRDFTINFGGSRAQTRNANFQLSVDLTIAETITGCNRTVQINDGGSVKTLDVKIPAGSQPGDTIKYSGMGSSNKNDLPAGDLFVHLIVKSIPDYHWQDGNLICERTISAWQAMLGTHVMVSDPFNAAIQVTVPAGCQPNSVLRVPGRGAYNRNIHQRGDILVKIIISIPNISDEQKQFIQTWI
jgi:DnaJ-class molecular chaperone